MFVNAGCNYLFYNFNINRPEKKLKKFTLEIYGLNLRACAKE